MTDNGRFDRCRELFEQALELPAGEREAFLTSECGGDDELYHELTSLLRADAGAGSFLEGPALDSGPDHDSWVGKTIGQYRIIEVIAAGGMGVVYRAEQEQPKRQVALKLIRAGTLSPSLIRRFELEAEVLGRLHHQGIAQIYEASTTKTDAGSQPYLVMELVGGRPLTRHAEEHKLRIAERIELLILICDAVHHAHQNGVIHRDLKPANILVDENGRPKVLDFGVARITDSDLQATTMRTDIGQLIGTLSYMSPEQVRGRPEDLDIRLDIYALGVLGYQLLTGRLPQKLEGKSITEAARIIEQEEPSSLGASGTFFPADLEIIIGKCLEKDKQRRYASTAELAADLRRFLGNEPISARSPSVVYQFRKFARRNRALVTGAGLAAAFLVAGLVISLAGWNTATRARQRAETEAEKARLLNSYLAEMVQAPDPWVEGPEVKVVDVLAKASETLDRTLGDQPEVAAIAHNHLGSTFYGLGQYDQSEPHLLRALELAKDIDDFPPETRVSCLRNLANLRIAQGELEQAETAAREAYDYATAHFSPEDPVVIGALHDLAAAIWERGEDDEEARRLFSQCLDLSRQVLGPRHEDTMATVVALGNVLRVLGEHQEGRRYLEEAYEYYRVELGEDHPSTTSALNNLAFIYQELEEHEKALEMFSRSLESRRRVHGEQSLKMIVGLNNMGLQLGLMDRPEEALPYLEQAVLTASTVLGDEHWLLWAARATYGRTLFNVGALDAAESELLAALQGMEKVFGPEHPRTKGICRGLAELYRTMGDQERAADFEALAR